MEEQRESEISTAIKTQARILETLARDVVLTGRLGSLARRFNLAESEFRRCLHELVRVGWIAVQVDPKGRLTLRLERRVSGVGTPNDEERRQQCPTTWTV